MGTYKYALLGGNEKRSKLKTTAKIKRQKNIDRHDPRPLTNGMFKMQKNGNHPCPKPLPTFATFPPLSIIR
jgi:hypothetical protein